MEEIDELFDGLDQKNDDQNRKYNLELEEQTQVTTKKIKLNEGQEKKVPVEFQAISQKQQNELANQKQDDSDISDQDILKEIDVHKVDNIKIINEKGEFGNCHHEVFYPENFPRQTRQNPIPAKKYKFVLDSFQEKAVQCLERNESVLVAAHTSAGKTAIAEYAIAMSKKGNQKVIYTSPIKALSNQKYRELQEEFGDVGLVTGDVSFNQNANCLVMTTEILRSMLYRGSEIIREVQWVIFDEVHYMRDKERGVVWEETIILLNEKVRFVFLSATIPNAPEFAEWICKIKKQPCHVVYTDYRPVPLQHYLFPTGGEGIYLVVDEKGTFREDNFNKAVGVLGDNVDLTNLNNKKRKKPTEGAELFKIVKMIVDKKFDPVIIFSFSKKEVEGYAITMSKMDLTDATQKESITNVFNNAISQLSQEDQQLPQIQQVLPMLKNGIGIHHGGLLPIIKEVIEIMFQEGWIKILFSTETFSMGLNMPAKTVVFTSVRKFDGENFRWIQGGEYIQMSGRAGRRGLDDKGITILMVDEKMDQEIAKSMLKGNANPLISSFHLNYNMLLNATRMEDTDPEYIIRRSLHQFQNDKAVPEMQEKYKALKDQMKDVKINNESVVEDVYKYNQNLRSTNEKIKRIIIQPIYVCPFLAIGRVLKLKRGDVDWGFGVSINFQRKKTSGGREKGKSEEQVVIIDVMIHIKPRKKNEEPQPQDINEEGEMEVIPMLLDCIDEITSIRLNLPQNLITAENKQMVKNTLAQIQKQYGMKAPCIHPVRDMKIDNEELDIALEKKEKYTLQIKEICKNYPDIDADLQVYEKKVKFLQSVKVLKKSIEDSQKMVLKDDLQCMKRVMRRLEFLDKSDIVQLKGKLACEISACDELLLTELIFRNIFNDMEPAAIAASLSVLMHDESSGSEKVQIKTEALSQAHQQIVEQARQIFKVFQESKINIEEKDYLGAIKPHLVEGVYAWCKGATFIEVCKMCEVYEGSIIRCMRRIDELLKQLQSAAKVIGNEALEIKFAEASKLLKRGIVFSASLYL